MWLVVGSEVRETLRPRLSPRVVVVCGAMFAVLVATSSGYGYHRAEMYFIVAGARAAFGYPDQPPLVPLLCQAMHQLAPGSLTVLRLPSALAAALVIFVAALVAREIGGGQRAQLIAAGCAAVSSIVAVTGHFVTTTTFDVLFTSVAGSAEGGRLGFIPFQLLLVSPALVPVWLVGLITAWRGGSSITPLRFLTVTYLALVALYLGGNGKAYYLASLYPALLGVGAVPVAEWTLRRRGVPSQPSTGRLVCSSLRSASLGR